MSAGESIKSIGVSADGKTLTLFGHTLFYEFPWEGGPLWAAPGDVANPGDVAKVQASLDTLTAAVNAMKAAATGRTIDQLPAPTGPITSANKLAVSQGGTLVGATLTQVAAGLPKPA